MYGVGAIIGAGIFALTGLAVQYAGPSLFLSFILAGFTSVCSAYMFAEFSSRFPSNGSAFIYVYTTFGELPAWIIGWYLMIAYGVACSGLSRALSYYLVGFLEKIGLFLPRWFFDATIFGQKDCCPIAPIFLILFAYINCRGTKESERFNTYLTSGKIITLLIIIAVAFTQFKTENMLPFFKPEYGASGTLLGASMLFFGIVGFDFLTLIAEEAKDASKDVPLAMRDSVLISTAFYVLVGISMCGMGLGRAPDFIPSTAIAD